MDNISQLQRVERTLLFYAIQHNEYLVQYGKITDACEWLLNYKWSEDLSRSVFNAILTFIHENKDFGYKSIEVLLGEQYPNNKSIWGLLLHSNIKDCCFGKKSFEECLSFLRGKQYE